MMQAELLYHVSVLMVSRSVREVHVTMCRFSIKKTKKKMIQRMLF